MHNDTLSQGKVHILAAEDNDVNRMVLEHTLSEQELSFMIVNDGAQAVEAWRRHTPEIILMDISMPVMNGLEAMTMIRKEEAASGKRIPIVALTAHALKGDEEKFRAAGADFYVTKPIRPEVLLELIKSVVGDARIRRGVA